MPSGAAVGGVLRARGRGNADDADHRLPGDAEGDEQRTCPRMRWRRDRRRPVDRGRLPEVLHALLARGGDLDRRDTHADRAVVRPVRREEHAWPGRWVVTAVADWLPFLKDQDEGVPIDAA